MLTVEVNNNSDICIVHLNSDQPSNLDTSQVVRLKSFGCSKMIVYKNGERIFRSPLPEISQPIEFIPMLQAGAVGLGVLLGTGSQGEIRSRREPGQALLRAEQCAREWRVLRGTTSSTALPSKSATIFRVYQPDVRVFEVFDADGKPMALFYCDYFKRDNKNGGAWMDNLVTSRSCWARMPVVFNVANFEKPAPGSPR